MSVPKILMSRQKLKTSAGRAHGFPSDARSGR